MTLHHFTCLFCCFGAYMINVPGFIILINFIHDIADISTSLSRALSESNYRKVCARIFISNCFVWAYTRLFVLPLVLITIFMNANDFAGPMLSTTFIYVFFFLQSCLVCLHAYWLSIFISMLMSFQKSGTTEDKVG